MDEKECEHEWVYARFVIATNPPIHPKICRKCGKREEERGEYVDLGEYDRLVAEWSKK